VKGFFMKAIYCRSSVKGNPTLQRQQQELAEMAKESGYELSEIEIYSDDGLDGSNSDWPAFARMKKDIENGKIDAVLTSALSCLGKHKTAEGEFEAIDFIKWLHEKEVGLFVKDNEENKDMKEYIFDTTGVRV
jgi:DNA invertase Pin-like site-specific DNA recombinase